MTLKKVNEKLSNFFSSISSSLSNKNEKIKKTAILGNFASMEDAELLRREARMTSEMLELPKYQKIINNLRGSIGIVNVVHHGGYSPLIELMLRKAFPAEANDIFKPEPLGDDYFVSKDYFSQGGTQGITQFMMAGNAKLEDLLKGTRVIPTKEWLKNVRKYDETKINDFIGPVDQNQVAIVLANPKHVPVSNPYGTYIMAYERRLNEIKATYDKYINALTKELQEHESGRNPIEDSGDVSYRSKKEERDDWIDRKRQEMNRLNIDIGSKISKEKNSGEYLRNRDGLATYNPKLDVMDAAVALYRSIIPSQKIQKGKDGQSYVSSSTHIDDVIAKAQHLKFTLEQYHPTTPKLKTYKDMFLSYLEGVDSADKKLENYDKLRKTIKSDFASLQSAFASSAKTQGKVIVFDDFDESVLCSRDSAQGGKIKIDKTTANIFANFMGKNEKILEEDDEESTRKGGRVILILSTEKISDLPSAKVVDMEIEPVDHDEAEIIVRNILRGYSNIAQNNALRRRNKEISQKNIDKKISDFDASKERDIAKKEIQSIYSTYKCISSKVIKDIISRIQGLSQKQAILVVRESLRLSAVYDDSLLDPDFHFDEKILDETVSDKVNAIHGSDTIGLVDIKSTVKFENYAYRTGEGAEWGERVPQIGMLGRDVKRTEKEIEDNESTINKIDTELQVSSRVSIGDPRHLTQQQIDQKKQEKEGLMASNEHLRLDLACMQANEFPHLYILWGSPGTGKSVFPEALADLLGIKIKGVDMGEAKDKWLGNTEANVRKLLNTMRSSKNIVFLFDEIDKQVSSGGGSEEQTHETTKALVGKFLTFFDTPENQEKFIENNVYFVMTTNCLESINRALVSRASVYEVKLPNKPEDYKKFFDNNLEVEMNRFPQFPWFRGPNDRTPEQGWATTKKILYGNDESGKPYIDWMKVSTVFAARSNDPGREVDFRTLKQMLVDMFQQNRAYSDSLKEISLGNTKQKITGVPLSTENLMAAAEHVSTTANGNNNINRGFLTLANIKALEANKKLEPYFSGEKAWEVETYYDPFTKKEKKRVKLPADVDEFMVGKVKDEEMEQEDIEEGEETEIESYFDPISGRMKKRVIKKKKTPTQEMEEISEKGFEKKPLLPEEEEELVTPEIPTAQPMKEKVKDTKKKDTGVGTLVKEKEKQNKPEEEIIESSTDYVYNYLLKQGFVDKNGELIAPPKISKGAVNQPQESINTPIADVSKKREPSPWSKDVATDENGVATFHYGFTMLIPK